MIGTTATARELSSGARHLFNVLKEFARGKNWPECWPHLWRICEEAGKSRRMVLYYIRELEIAGAIQVDRSPGKGSTYRIMLPVNERIGDWIPVAPVQPIAPVPVQPIAPVPVQPIAPVPKSAIIIEAINTASSAGSEAPAAAAEKKTQGEDVIATTKSVLDELVKLGMPASAENVNKVALCPDFARDVLRHCKRRFGKRKKPVDNPGGYVAALLRDPAKFGWVQKDGVWQDPEKPSGLTAEEVAAQIAITKAKSKELLARTQADAEKAYADMRDVWDRLPEAAKNEVRDYVSANSGLYHRCGEDVPEFEICCIREASKPTRALWRKKHLAMS